MKKHLLTFIVLSLFATCAWSQSMSPIGTWVNEEGKARFEIYACSDKLCGKIVSLKEPLKDGKPKVDENNPNKKLQSRPLQGLVFLKGFEYDGDNMWDEGTIYDPETFDWSGRSMLLVLMGLSCLVATAFYVGTFVRERRLRNNTIFKDDL